MVRIRIVYRCPYFFFFRPPTSPLLLAPQGHQLCIDGKQLVERLSVGTTLLSQRGDQGQQLIGNELDVSPPTDAVGERPHRVAFT